MLILIILKDVIFYFLFTNIISNKIEGNRNRKRSEDFGKFIKWIIIF